MDVYVLSKETGANTIENCITVCLSPTKLSEDAQKPTTVTPTGTFDTVPQENAANTIESSSKVSGSPMQLSDDEQYPQ